MRATFPAAALAIAILLGGAFVLLVYLWEVDAVSENPVVRAHRQVEQFLETEYDFDKIVDYVQADPDRGRFLGLTLVHLAQEESRYVDNFERRYPRYKAYRDMIRELQRSDYSPWVASVVSGRATTEFDSNVLEYLTTLENDDRYLDAAIERYTRMVESTGKEGFTSKSQVDAFKVGCLAYYIMQFPEHRTASLKALLLRRVADFVASAARVKGLPLNQVYIALYLKYHSLESLIDLKMREFLSSATVRLNWRTWSLDAVEKLIGYFCEIGQGIPQNLYALFSQGFRTNDPMRLYIALQVMEKIGFDDPDLIRWLQRSYARYENTLYITTSDVTGREVAARRVISFADEVAETRSKITGKADTPLSVVLKEAVDENKTAAGVLVPRVTALEEAHKELAADSRQYSQVQLRSTLACWAAKRSLLLVVAIASLVAMVTACLRAAFASYPRLAGAGNFLAWLPAPIIGGVLFFGVWNSYTGVSDFLAGSSFAYVALSGVIVVPAFVKSPLAELQRGAWRSILRGYALFALSCGASRTAYRYVAASGNDRRLLDKTLLRDGRPVDPDTMSELPEATVSALAQRAASIGRVERAMEVLEANGRPALSQAVVREARDRFCKVGDSRMDRLLQNRFEFVTWLKTCGKEERLASLRADMDVLTGGTVPASMVIDDDGYADLLADMLAFSTDDPETKRALSAIVSKTMAQRARAGRHRVPDVTRVVVDMLSLELDPSVIFTIAQVDRRSASWAWQKLCDGARATESPDEWFGVMLGALDPDMLERWMDVGAVVHLIDICFRRCVTPVPALILLAELRTQADNKDGDVARLFGDVYERHRASIEEMMRRLSHLEVPPEGETEDGDAGTGAPRKEEAQQSATRWELSAQQIDHAVSRLRHVELETGTGAQGSKPAAPSLGANRKTGTCARCKNKVTFTLEMGDYCCPECGWEIKAAEKWALRYG